MVISCSLTYTLSVWSGNVRGPGEQQIILLQNGMFD